MMATSVQVLACYDWLKQRSPAPIDCAKEAEGICWDLEEQWPVSALEDQDGDIEKAVAASLSKALLTFHDDYIMELAEALAEAGFKP